MQQKIENISDNTVNCSPSFLNCSRDRRNSKTLFLELKNAKNTTVLPCSSIIKGKEYRNNNSNIFGPKEENNIYISNVWKKRGNIGTNNPVNSIPTHKDHNTILPDKRLENPAFKEAVKSVLDYMGEDNNFGSFKKYDAAYGSEFPIDWVVFAKRLENPVHYAVCFVRCNNPRVAPIGSRIQTPAGWLTETVALPGATQDEALLKLNKQDYEFKEWRQTTGSPVGVATQSRLKQQSAPDPQPPSA